MIIHLLHYLAFIDYTIEQFELIDPNNNKYYIYGHKSIDDLNSVANKNYLHQYPQGDVNKLIEEINNDQVDAIIFHSLNSHAFPLALKYSGPAVMLWIVYGFDLYPLLKDYNKRILMLTTRQINSNLAKQKTANTILDHCKNILRPYYHSLTGKAYRMKTSPAELLSNAVGKMDYACSFLTEQHLLVKKEMHRYPNHIWFCYYSIQTTVGTLLEAQVCNNNILLGNSAAATNNHIEAFKLLKQFDLTKIKVITPLSYGGERYRDIILAKGKNTLKTSFHPLVEFMPRKDYNKILLDCGIVIMNHLRSQGIGNILTTLWLGAKVYLNETNPAFQYFTRLGVNIFSIQKHLKPSNKNVFTLLSQADIDHNRDILLREHGQEAVLKHTRKLVELAKRKCAR